MVWKMDAFWLTEHLQSTVGFPSFCSLTHRSCSFLHRQHSLSLSYAPWPPASTGCCTRGSRAQDRRDGRGAKQRVLPDDRGARATDPSWRPSIEQPTFYICSEAHLFMRRFYSRKPLWLTKAEVRSTKNHPPKAAHPHSEPQGWVYCIIY